MDTQRVTRFPMRKGEIITIDRPDGWSIKAHAGRFWITQSNHQEDIFLESGNVFVAQGNGMLVAEAMNHSLISLTDPNTVQAQPARSALPQFAAVAQGV